MSGPFTFISNPSEEGERMAGRSLERPGRGAAAAAKKKPEAQLVLANGGEPMNESMRIGLVLVGAGVTGVTIGVLEGLSRRGKVQWYGKMSAAKKATLLLAYFVAAGALARQRRTKGDYKGCCALEAAAISAFTIAVMLLAEAGAAKSGELKGLGLLDGGADTALARLDADQLSKLDDILDDDIRRAAAELRQMTERGELAVEPAGDDVAGLAVYGQPTVHEYDDDEMVI